jgi:hypothetical protein
MSDRPAVREYLLSGLLRCGTRVLAIITACGVPEGCLASELR